MMIGGLKTGRYMSLHVEASLQTRLEIRIAQAAAEGERRYRDRWP